MTAELFGDEVPAERRVVRRAVSVAVAALDRLRVEDGTGAAALEQAVDGADTLPRDVGLVAPVAGAIELGEALRAVKRDPRGALRELRRLAKEFSDTESGVRAEQEARGLLATRPELDS